MAEFLAPNHEQLLRQLPIPYAFVPHHSWAVLPTTLPSTKKSLQDLFCILNLHFVFFMCHLPLLH